MWLLYNAGATLARLLRDRHARLPAADGHPARLVWPDERLRRALPALECSASRRSSGVLLFRTAGLRPDAVPGGFLAGRSAAQCWSRRSRIRRPDRPSLGVPRCAGSAAQLRDLPLALADHPCSSRASTRGRARASWSREAALVLRGCLALVPLRRGADPARARAAMALAVLAPLPARGRRCGSARSGRGLRCPVRDAVLAEPGVDLREPAESQRRHHTRRTRARSRARTSPPRQHKQTKQNSLPPGRILALGDSVMLGCKSELKIALHHHVHVDATVGRQIEDTVNELQRLRRAPQADEDRRDPGREQRPALVSTTSSGYVTRCTGSRTSSSSTSATRRAGRTSRTTRSSAGCAAGRRRTSPTGTPTRRTRCFRTAPTPWPYGCTIYARVIADALRST